MRRYAEFATLCTDTIARKIDKGCAPVGAQIQDVRLRAVEVERKVAEADEYLRRIEGLEQRMDELEASAASEAERVMRRELTDEEVIETLLILLAYIYEGDTRRFADYLMAEPGSMDAGAASELAEYLGDLLEERRRIASDLRPV